MESAYIYGRSTLFSFMKKENHRPFDDNLKKLKLAVWEKAIGNKIIAKGNHYYEQISDKIGKATQFSISKDTIRNFIEEKHTPSQKALIIYSSFVLGASKARPSTYSDFVSELGQEDVPEELQNTPSSKHNRWPIIFGLLLLLVGMLCLFFCLKKENTPHSRSFKAIAPITSSKLEMIEEMPPRGIDFYRLLDDFVFDSTSTVNLAEGRRMIEWFGVEEYTFSDILDPTLTGYLPNGCKLSVILGARGWNDTYSINCDCGEINPAYISAYTSIAKASGTQQFYKRFYDSNLENLKRDGWFLFQDSINEGLWDNPEYRDSAYLTMETHSGGSYLDNRDYDPLTINILTHEIDCGACCEIYVKLVHFNPYQRYQSAGFYIFYNETPVPSTSYVLIGIPNESKNVGRMAVQAIHRHGEYTNWVLLRDHEKATVSKMEEKKVLHPVDSLILKVVIKRDEYVFLKKTTEDHFLPIDSRRIYTGYQPKYIGLYACQGRPEIPYPIYPVAEIIPAHFEYVKIEPCDEVTQ